MPAVSIVGYYIIRKCFKVHVHNQYLQATIFIKLFKGKFYGQYYMSKYFLKMFNGICRLPLIASYTLGHIFGSNHFFNCNNINISIRPIGIQILTTNMYHCICFKRMSRLISLY